MLPFVTVAAAIYSPGCRLFEAETVRATVLTPVADVVARPGVKDMNFAVPLLNSLSSNWRDRFVAGKLSVYWRLISADRPGATLIEVVFAEMEKGGWYEAFT